MRARACAHGLVPCCAVPCRAVPCFILSVGVCLHALQRVYRFTTSVSYSTITIGRDDIGYNHIGHNSLARNCPRTCSTRHCGKPLSLQRRATSYEAIGSRALRMAAIM